MEENNENNNQDMIPIKEKGKKSAVITVVIVFVIILIAIIAGVNSKDKKLTEGKATIGNSDITINLPQDYTIYDTVSEISEKYGSQVSSYYDIVILDPNKEVELYGGVTLKSLVMERYSLESLIGVYKESAEETYTEVSEIQTRKIGDYEFKYYTFNFGTETTYLGNMFIAENEESFIFFDCYTDMGNQAKIDEVLEKLFK